MNNNKKSPYKGKTASKATNGSKSKTKSDNVKEKTISSRKFNNSGLFYFRRYKKIEGGEIKKGKHPKLIVDEKYDKYGFMGLTKSHKRGNHKNIELTQNPLKGKSDKAYIRDELRYDNKKNFEEILTDYNLTKQDKEKILKYLERHKKKK